MKRKMQKEQVRPSLVAAKETRRASLNRLNQDTLSLRKDLEQLENMEAASASGVCKEILNDVEARPDPLLPTTNGPANPSWDRWFEGPQDKPDCKCWIL